MVLWCHTVLCWYGSVAEVWAAAYNCITKELVYFLSSDKRIFSRPRTVRKTEDWWRKDNRKKTDENKKNNENNILKKWSSIEYSHISTLTGCGWFQHKERWPYNWLGGVTWRRPLSKQVGYVVGRAVLLTMYWSILIGTFDYVLAIWRIWSQEHMCLLRGWFCRNANIAEDEEHTWLCGWLRGHTTSSQPTSLIWCGGRQS